MLSIFAINYIKYIDKKKRNNLYKNKRNYVSCIKEIIFYKKIVVVNT